MASIGGINLKNRYKTTLIKSISGIKGSNGGGINNNLTSIDAVKFVAAYGSWLKNNSEKKQLIIC